MLFCRIGYFPAKQFEKPRKTFVFLQLHSILHFVTDLSGQMLTFDGVWHFGKVFSSWMNPGFHCTGQMADSLYGVVWVSGLLMSMLWTLTSVAHGGDGVMVWAGVCYGQRTQVHFIDDILNAQRYRDEILRPIVVPFIHDHHLMLQNDYAQPHVARICTQFLEAENIPRMASILTAQTCYPLSMFGML